MATATWAVEGSHEWRRVWAALEDELARQGLPLDRAAACDCCGEVWQYMGPDGPDGASSFRHRHHPATGTRIYLRVFA
jgi:hypothetical protein